MNENETDCKLTVAYETTMKKVDIVTQNDYGLEESAKG